MSGRYDFLVETYATERLKVLSVWSLFEDEDLPVQPHPEDARGRSVLEQMVHQCISEDFWFKNILGIDVAAPPLPEKETRDSFIQRYAQDSRRRLESLRNRPAEWWQEMVKFFDVERSRSWVMVRRMAHTSHHRGQQTAMLRMLNRDLYSTYGPSADTGGLMAHQAPTIYPYRNESELLAGVAGEREKNSLPAPGRQPVTERP